MAGRRGSSWVRYQLGALPSRESVWAKRAEAAAMAKSHSRLSSLLAKGVVDDHGGGHRLAPALVGPVHQVTSYKRDGTAVATLV